MKLARITALTAFMCTTASIAAAADTTISLWTGPKHPVNAGGYAPFVEMLRDKGWDVQIFEGGALLDAKPALAGIGDGIADIGQLAMTYFPAEFPHAQLVADMGLSTPNNLTAMAAATEYNLLHCEPCLEEYKTANTLYMGTYATAPYSIISTSPIRSTADLKGKKMRVPGSLWSRWAQSVGGIEVNVPSSEMFEGLDKGALDIAIQSPGALRSYQLWDVAKYVTDLNLGTYHSLSLLTINRDYWAELTEEERNIIKGDAARVCVDTTLLYTTTDEEVVAEMPDRGVELIDAGEEMRSTKAAFVEGDAEAIVSGAESIYGISDAQARFDTLNELIDKWAKIVEETGGEREAMIAKMNEEIFDKLPADYGLN